MSLTREFPKVKDSIMQFIIQNPGVSSIDLMIHFDWHHDWKRSELIRPLFQGHGINGNKVFLFRSMIARIAYYYELGFAIENNIPAKISLKKSKVDRNKADRDRAASGRAESIRHNQQEHERLVSYTRVMHMMKVPETV